MHTPSAYAQSVDGCNPKGATPATNPILDGDGVVRIDGNIRLSLSGLLWPDALEQKIREDLHKRLSAALADQTISWKPAAAQDRWGNIPAYLFVQERGGSLPPFWLQAGIVEAGLAPAWPNLIEKNCWHILRTHEERARRKGIGFWAARAQMARHSAIRANLPANLGRRLVGRWKVSSVKTGRAVQFVNLGAAIRGGSTLWLSQSQASAFVKASKNSIAWQGKWIILRFVLNEHGFRRIRLENADFMDVLDDAPATPPLTAP